MRWIGVGLAALMFLLGGLVGDMVAGLKHGRDLAQLDAHLQRLKAGQSRTLALQQQVATEALLAERAARERVERQALAERRRMEAAFAAVKEGVNREREQADADCRVGDGFVGVWNGALDAVARAGADGGGADAAAGGPPAVPDTPAVAGATSLGR